jgi:integrase
MSDVTMAAVVAAAGGGDATPHGFRSTFRDWAAEATSYPRDVCEAALAHAVGNQVEAAYRRGDLLTKRQALMAAWATFCDRPMIAGEVVPINRHV